MKILYIGEPATYEKYCRGIVPSHWLYGAVEMQKDGHTVIWEQERTGLWNDLRHICRCHPDVVFIPNLNVEAHLLLLLAKSLRLISIPIYAYLHHGRPADGTMRNRLIRWSLKCIDHLFFLSQRSLDETATKGSIAKERCSVPGWGPDMEFYSKVESTDGGRFISTGKENRDFGTLIEAFRTTGAPLTIMTAKEHSSQNYSWLEDACKDADNIELVFMPNSGDSYPTMLRAMAASKAIVCPLLPDHLNYCVGLSTIADAEGLHKSLIITSNLYHDKNRMSSFETVGSVEDWIAAIRRVQENVPHAQRQAYSMATAYEAMKRAMFS